jgi:5-methylcytosine-specific restriction enzyme subunit McrC
MSLTPVTLKEWKPTRLKLDVSTAAALRAVPKANLRVSVTDTPGEYEIMARSTVGVFSGPATVLIIPKLEIERFFYLLGHASDVRFFDAIPALAKDENISDAFVRSFLAMLKRRVMRRGLLQGYVVRDEALHEFRGRLRVTDQMRRHQGLMLPLEVRYEDYTVDIVENRLLKAALERVVSLPVVTTELRAQAAMSLSAFADVTSERFRRKDIPNVTFDRLSRHYEAPVELARLLLDNSSVDLRPGAVPVGQFSVDMNVLFQQFLFGEVRRRLPTGVMWKAERHIHLDVKEEVLMKPDFSAWRGGECLFVADAKYKRTEGGESGDLYQLLAYCHALGLEEGTIIYADAASGLDYEVVRSHVRLRVMSIDLAAPMSVLEDRLDELAARVAGAARDPT